MQAHRKFAARLHDTVLNPRGATARLALFVFVGHVEGLAEQPHGLMPTPTRPADAVRAGRSQGGAATKRRALETGTRGVPVVLW
jgi:hypothetical protein